MKALPDIEGECNARLFIGDDYGDGTATMRCAREPGHKGAHREIFQREGRPVKVSWYVDETRCEACEGIGVMFLDLDDWTDEGKNCEKCGGTGRKVKRGA